MKIAEFGCHHLLRGGRVVWDFVLGWGREAAFETVQNVQYQTCGIAAAGAEDGVSARG